MGEVKNSFLNRFLHLAVLVSTLITYLLRDLFYNSVGSPDFYRYSKYFKYFFGDINSTELEQGLIYYYLNSVESKFELLKNSEPNIGTYENCINNLNKTLSLNKSNYRIHNTPFVNISFYIVFVFLTIDMFLRKQK